MKILHTVEFYYPSVGGMQEVVKQLSEHLVKLGHQVTVATSRSAVRTEKTINGVKIAEFDISGNLVRGLKGDISEYEQFLLGGDFDIITNFAAQQWATDIMLPLLERIKIPRVFVPTGFSGLYAPEYKEYFENMKQWMLKYDMNVFLSDDYRDINFARECGVEKRVLIPNGASEEEFLPDSEIDIRKKLGIPADHFLILHVGSHTGVKGHAEAIKIFQKARIKKAVFLLVANSFGGGCTYSCRVKELLLKFSPGQKKNDKRLIVTSLSRKETVAAYKEADLFLFPSNIECSPLVLFECMASRTPFLTTDVGNAAEIVGWSGSGLVLPTKKLDNGYSQALINPAVEMVEAMYARSETRKDMQASGYKAWIKGFTWDKIARDYEQIYLGLMKRG